MPSCVSNLPSRIWDTPQRLIYKDLKSIFPDTDLYHKCRQRILTHMTGAQHDGIITAGLLFFFSFSKWNVIFYALFFSPQDTKVSWGWLKRIKPDSKAGCKSQDEQEYIYIVFRPWIWLNSITQDYCMQILSVVTVYSFVVLKCLCHSMWRRNQDLQNRMATPHSFSVIQCEIMRFRQQKYVLIIS